MSKGAESSGSGKRGKTRTIKVDYLARVEGEGAMYVKIKGDRVADVKLRIYEPPRFFEGLLRGRRHSDAPDITARICGICPIAYQMSACHAIEDACGARLEGPLRELRRLIYCGEWIESHALHVYMLHAPDFLGYPSAIDMARDAPDVVQRGLDIKKTGNAIVALLGGREIHPINVCVGGFYSVPTRAQLAGLRDPLLRARDAAVATVDWVAGFDFPDFERDYEMVALSHPDEYPFNQGTLVSNRGLDIPVRAYNQHFEEVHVPHSTALHSVHKGHGAYFVGPMARYSLNFARLSSIAQEAARRAGLGPVCKNPFQSIVVRAVEILYACDEALRIIDGYDMPDAPAVAVTPRAAEGHGCTEAPRGILYHRYVLDDDGFIQDAQIVPPTSQNQKTIEDDLFEFVSNHVELAKDQLTWRCEQAIRNYDPCISCATHFLDLTLERE
jgi:sulfhydrogenase subunit alpha